MKSIKVILKRKLYPRLFLFFLTLLSIVWLSLNLSAPRIPLLGFHSIIDEQNKSPQVILGEPYAKMDYSKQDLEKLLDYLMQNNFWFLSTQELYDYFLNFSKQIPPEYIGKRPIMLSFDDSYKTYYSVLIPILENLEKKYHYKAKVVLFINPGTMINYDNAGSRRLSCKHLREGLVKGYYDVQSHGQNHKKLTELQPQELLYELSTAQDKLRTCTQGITAAKDVANHIAYPYGSTNRQVEKYASKYYLSGYLYNSRIFKLGWVKKHYRIPRLTVNQDKSPARLIQMAERALKVTEKDVKN